MDVLENQVRRQLLVGLGATGVGAAATGGFGVAAVASDFGTVQSATDRQVRLATANLEDWSQKVGSQFYAQGGQRLKLVEVQAFPDHRDRPAALRSRAFAARFEIEQGGALEAEVYALHHPRGGTFMVRLDPVSPDKPREVRAVFG